MDNPYYIPEQGIAQGLFGGFQQGMALKNQLRQAKQQQDQFEMNKQMEAEKLKAAQFQNATDYTDVQAGFPMAGMPLANGDQGPSAPRPMPNSVTIPWLEKQNDWRRQLALAKASQVSEKPSKLNADEAKTLKEAATSARGVASLGDTFENKGMQNVNWMQRGLKKMPLIGQGGTFSGPLDSMMPDTTDYLNQQRLQVENDLRAATGAAAPDSEVKTYLMFMPQPGDSKEQAANKLENYYNRINNKIEGVAAAHEAEGDYRGADKIRANMRRNISGSGLGNTVNRLKNSDRMSEIDAILQGKR